MPRKEEAQKRMRRRRVTQNNDAENKVVVIVGGGIAGCAVACELARRGYEKNVLLLEKDESESSRRQGYGLTISETNTAIEKMKVLNALKRENVSSKQHWTIDARNGDVLGYFGQLFREYLFVSSKSSESSKSSSLPRRREDDEEEEEGISDGRGGEKERKGNLRVPRNVVREILLERIPKENILWNAEVENIEMDDVGNSAATITLKKNRHRPTNVLIENCALIVAADGSHSKVQKIRQELYGKEVVPDLKYLGVVLITGFTSLKHYLLNNRGFYAVDGQSRMFTMPFADENKDDNREQKTMWQLSVRCDEREAKRLYGERESTCFDQIIKQFCMEKTNHWRGVPIAKMFEKTDFSHAWAGPLYDREEPTKIVDDGIIAVIGDASHPMSPFKGQGANTAIEDAWLLCEWLGRAKAPKFTHRSEMFPSRKFCESVQKSPTIERGVRDLPRPGQSLPILRE